MKSLQTIQKTFQFLQVLTKVAMILKFVGAGLLLLGLICGVVISSTGTVVSGDVETLYKLTTSQSFNEMVGTLLVEFVLTLTDAILLLYAFRYFSTEQMDGTPFSDRGANQMKRLGILLLVLPAVAAILGGALCYIFNLTQSMEVDLSNEICLIMSIVLIIESLIIRYGAELESNIGTEKSITE